MTPCLRKSCSFVFLCMSFVNVLSVCVCVPSLLVLRLGVDFSFLLRIWLAMNLFSLHEIITDNFAKF